MPINYTMWTILLLTIPIFFLLRNILSTDLLEVSESLGIFVCVVGIIVVIILGFFGAAIGGYFAGLVGSSTSPLSGLTLCVLLLNSFLLLLAFHQYIRF